jgi:hypothetical protein
VVILIGAELNAEMEHQTARDTTEGVVRNLSACGVQSLLTASAQLKFRESAAAEPDSRCRESR